MIAIRRAGSETLGFVTNQLWHRELFELISRRSGKAHNGHIHASWAPGVVTTCREDRSQEKVSTLTNGRVTFSSAMLPKRLQKSQFLNPLRSANRGCYT